MQFIKKFFVVVSGIILIFFIILIHYGLFAKIEFTLSQSSAYTLVYDVYIGDYSKMGKITDQIYYDMKNKYKISPNKGFGIFYDDPKKVKPEKLRSVVGVILENVSDEKILEIRKKYRVEILPASKAIITKFPLKGNLSYALGAIRVYPEMMKYVSENKIAPSFPMEIYDLKNEKIIYQMTTEIPNEIYLGFLSNPDLKK